MALKGWKVVLQVGAGEEATKLHASRTLLLVGEEAVVVQDRVAGEGEERGELG